MATTIWLAQRDLETDVSVDTVKGCCDDNQDGVADPAVVAQVIDRGEQEVMSWLVGIYGPPPLSTAVMAQLAADNFLKYRALDYAICFMFARHPEGIPADKGNEIAARRKRCDAAMERIVNANQRAVTVPTPPANVGGVAASPSPHIFSTYPDGRRVSGDY